MSSCGHLAFAVEDNGRTGPIRQGFARLAEPIRNVSVPTEEKVTKHAGASSQFEVSEGTDAVLKFELKKTASRADRGSEFVESNVNES